jgi:HEAT repeat protein
MSAHTALTEILAVPQGLSVTFDTLTTTRNEAAVDVLVRGLGSPDAVIRDRCLAGCLDRRSPSAHLEVLRRLDDLDAQSLETLAAKSGRISQALRQSVLDPDAAMCANGCKIALMISEFDLIPLLATGVQDPECLHRELLSKTLRDLSVLLYEELANPTEAMHNRTDHRDPQLMRDHITGPLENAVREFGRHRRDEIVEAFLLIARPGNTTLSTVLADPFHAAYLTVVDQLLHSPSHGVVGLLLNYLEEVNPPSAAMTSLGKRTDIEFWQYLFRRVAGRVSKTTAVNLRRIDDITWVQEPGALIDQLDEDEQRTAIEVLMASRVPRLDVYGAIAHTLANGKPGGRHAAAVALAEFNGAEANNLAMVALEDDDPKVQATMISQVRARGIPGVLGRLLIFTDSPHENVRAALLETLDEFNFERFFASFDKLDDHVRATTAALVRKIDSRSVELLAHELASRSPARRLRAVTAADLMGVVSDLEEQIVDLLEDTDHSIRVQAVRSLAVSPTNATVQALAEAMHDSSDLVREAAEESLLLIKELRDQAAEVARGKVEAETRNTEITDTESTDTEITDTETVELVATGEGSPEKAIAAASTATVSVIPKIPPPPEKPGETADD